MATFYPPIDWTRHRLHAAAASGNKEVVEQLIKEGADVNEHVSELLPFDDVAGTPLHVTVSSCPWNYPYRPTAWFAPEGVFNAYYEIVEALLNAGANAHRTRAWAGTPLHDAARRGLVDIVKLLVSHGVDINCKEDYEGRTPLHLAAGNNCLQVVEYLLSNGAEIDEVALRNPPKETRCLRIRKGEAVGLTPLQLAAREGHAGVVKALVEAGASLDRATAIDLAVRSKRQTEGRFDEIIGLLS
jgi:serine/threonine-protein phosphatase 6 regulatory ankyrin repeat subunit A